MIPCDLSALNCRLRVQFFEQVGSRFQTEMCWRKSAGRRWPGGVVGTIFSCSGNWLRLFGEGFSEKAKKRDDELRALDKVSGNSSGGKRRAQNAGSQASFFSRAKTQNGKHRHFSGSGRGRPRYGPYPQATSSKKDRTPKWRDEPPRREVTESPDTILQSEI